jgi:hypothetical protein
MAVKLSKEVMEMVQTLLDVRNTLDDVLVDARHTNGVDALFIRQAADSSISAIDMALDLIKYND